MKTLIWVATNILDDASVPSFNGTIRQIWSTGYGEDFTFTVASRYLSRLQATKRKRKSFTKVVTVISENSTIPRCPFSRSTSIWRCQLLTPRTSHERFPLCYKPMVPHAILCRPWFERIALPEQSFVGSIPLPSPQEAVAHRSRSSPWPLSSLAPRSFADFSQHRLRGPRIHQEELRRRNLTAQSAPTAVSLTQGHATLPGPRAMSFEFDFSLDCQQNQSLSWLVEEKGTNAKMMVKRDFPGLIRGTLIWECPCEASTRRHSIRPLERPSQSRMEA